MTTTEDKGDSPMINDDSVVPWVLHLATILNPAGRNELEDNPDPRDYDPCLTQIQRYSEAEIDGHDKMLRDAFNNCSIEEVINLSCRTIVSSVRVANRYLNAQHINKRKVKEAELRMQKCKEELDKHRFSVIDLQWCLVYLSRQLELIQSQ